MSVASARGRGGSSLLALLLLGSAPCPPDRPCTELAETIYAPLRLDPATTYRVTRQVVVAFDASLTIPAGTRVYFEPGTDLVSFGQLFVEGSAEQPVLLTSGAAAPVPGDWKGVKIADRSTGSVIRGAQIEFAARAIQIDKSSATLSDNRIAHALGGIDLLDALPTRVLRNTLSGVDGTGIGISVIRYEPESEPGSELLDNAIRGYRAGIYLADASPRVSGNTVESNQIGIMVDRGRASILSNSIRGNTSRGIWLSGAGQPVVKGNALLENGRPAGFDLYIDVPRALRSVDARENFWGTTDAAEIAQRIFDGADAPAAAAAEICPVRERAGGELRACAPPH